MNYSIDWDSKGEQDRDIDPGPWDWNEHGLWCPNCGDIIAAPWMLTEEDYKPASHCKSCGFPDFGT